MGRKVSKAVTIEPAHQRVDVFVCEALSIRPLTCGESCTKAATRPLKVHGLLLREPFWWMMYEGFETCLETCRARTGARDESRPREDFEDEAPDGHVALPEPLEH